MPRWKTSSFLIAGLVAVLGIMVVYPMLTVFYGSFVKEGPLNRDAGFTLDGYRQAYLNWNTYKILGGTLWLSAVRTILAMGLAVFLAWAITRTDMPWQRPIELAVWVSLFMPLPPLVFAWIALMSPNGLVNQLIADALHLDKSPLTIFSYGGIIWVSVLLWTSAVFIIIAPAFKRMDAAFDEAARMSGATGWRAFRDVTLPLLAPAILGGATLIFVRLIGSFEIEVFLGLPARIFVYSTKIYDYLSYTPVRYPLAMALTTVVQALCLGLAVAQWRTLKSSSYVVVTGRGFSARRAGLGRWKYPVLGLVLLYIAVSLVLPFAVLIASSFMKLFGTFRADLATLDNYRAIIHDSAIWSSLKNTLLVGAIASTAGTILYALVSYVIVKTSSRARKLLDLMSWLPYTVPSMALALGFLWAFVGLLPLGSVLYGTLLLMVVVSIARALPLGVRTMNGSLIQLSNELEEASRVHGASWLATFRRIVVPLVSPALAATWMIIFLGVWRELVTYVLLYVPKSRLVAVTMFEYWQGGRVETAATIGLVTMLAAIPLAVIAQKLSSLAEGTASAA